MTATITTTTTATLERGATTVADRTVERIAVHTLSEVDDVDGESRRTVSATRDGHTVALTVRLSVTYPASVRATARAARTHLMARVEELTGLPVSRVDITVTALPSTATTVRRVQ